MTGISVECRAELRALAADCRHALSPSEAMLAAGVDELLDEIDRLEDTTADTFPKTWDGFRAFLDEHYPADVFPPSSEGPEAVRVARVLAESLERVEVLSARVAELEQQRQAVIDLRPQRINVPAGPVEWDTILMHRADTVLAVLGVVSGGNDGDGEQR